MGLDLLVCCVFAYWLVKHTPELVGEAFQEWGYARRGEESPAAAARRARLAAAGVDPVAGGGFGQYAGNVWRDFWLDKDRERRQRRADRLVDAGDAASESTEGTGWWARIGTRVGERLDEAVDRQASKWKSRRAGRDEAGNPTPDGDAGHVSDPTPSDQQPDPDRTDPAGPGSGSTAPDPGDPGLDDNRLDPIRVDATLGEPCPTTAAPVAIGTQPAVLEGETMTAVATRGTAITGVVSGATEARSIQRALAAATAAYQAAVAEARNRINSMGQQTLSTVQMAGRSTVVQACSAAAEAIASAQASVNGCNAEVIPLLGRVAREFDKRNS